MLILRCLVEGMGVRGTARTAAVSKNTVQKLLLEAGRVCDEYQDAMLRDLPCQRIQVDELWSYLYAKERNVATAKAAPGSGDLWTAICADTKLVPAWRVGDRGMETAVELLRDLRGWLANRVQITTDGLVSYFEAGPYVFGEDGADFAAVVKLYGDPEHAVHVTGRPDPDHINTCYIERHNLTIRASMRRYARRTIGFSRKLANHTANLALFSSRTTSSSRSLTRKGGPPTTPAMAAGITDWPMKLDHVVELLESN